MAGPWDALGRGIESGVSAFLQGQEQQLRRKREEEEKAQREKEWILSKFQAQAGMEQADWARQQTEIKGQEAKHGGWFVEPNPAQGIEGVPNYRELGPGSYIPIPLAEKQAMLKSQMEGAREWERKTRLEEIGATGRAAAGKKEPLAEDILYNPGFNPEAAWKLLVAYSGIDPGNIRTLLMSPMGQGKAEDIVKTLVGIYGNKWPSLSRDYWGFLKGFNPKLRSPEDIISAPAQPRPPAPQTGMTFPPLSATPPTTPPRAVGAGATVRELLPTKIAAITEKTAAGKPMRMTDASGRTWYWDAAQGMWMQE